MRLRKCRFINMGPFVDWVLDLTRLREDQKLIALVGKNGRGKSAALELSMLGGCYLNTPTQGRVANRATASDSVLEPTIVHAGREWTIRHMFNAVGGGSNHVVIGEDGAPLWKKAGARQFADWAEQNLPPRSVVEASLFRYQSSEGFVQMDSAARIAVLLRVIGVERLERKAKIASENAKEEQKKLDELLRRIEDIRGGDPGVEASTKALADALEAAAGAESALADARSKLAAAQERVAAHAIRKTAREAADKLIQTLREQAEGAARRRADAELRIKGNQQIHADGDAIRAAATELEAANAELTRLELDLVEADKQIAGLLYPWRDGLSRLKAAQQRRASAQFRLRDQAQIEAAVVSREGLSLVAKAAADAVAATESELVSANGQQIAGASERVQALRDGHDRILRSEPAAAHEIAAGCMSADDASRKTAVEVPRRITELTERLRDERNQAAVAARALSDADKLAARAEDVKAAAIDLAAADNEAAEIVAGHAIAVIGAALRSLGRLDLAAAARGKAVSLEPMRKLASRLPALEDYGRRVEELERQAADARAEEERIAAQIAGVELVEVGDTPAPAAARAGVDEAEKVLASARTVVAKAEQALAQSRAVGAKLDELLGQRADVEAELADWTRLALDHGRAGMQSDEVDAAGPELTGYINSCLRHCVGTRWTMSVETQRLDAEGKNLIDKCTFQVIDNLRGTVREVKEHSGGERTALAEAISSGLTMLGCRRAGFERPTLVRDESANFLDEEAAPLWIKMMRYVVDFTNADRLLFVSHNSDVRRLADAVIEIPDQRGVQSESSQAA